jgi:hypothetical protein
MQGTWATPASTRPTINNHESRTQTLELPTTFQLELPTTDGMYNTKPTQA